MAEKQAHESRRVTCGGLTLSDTFAFLIPMPSNHITGPDDPRVVACREARAKGAKWLAEQIGLKRQAVQNWQVIPANHCVAVEEATGISRHKLRPDVFGDGPGDSVAA